MTVYRDAGHCIARVMSIETNTCTAQSAWQRLYESGFPEVSEAGSGLTAEERLTQDAMTRALLHRNLPRAQWHALVAKYSINDNEVRDSIRWLIRNIETPAHHLFKMKAVMAWAVPRRLPEAFYNISTWDNEGKPESTLRRWRQGVHKWLNSHVDGAHVNIETMLEECGLALLESSREEERACI